MGTHDDLHNRHDERDERDERVERRRLLRYGGVAAAGAAAAVVASAQPAAAGTDGDIVLGSNTKNNTTLATAIGIVGTTAGYGFGVVDNGLSTLSGRKPTLLVHAAGKAFQQAIYVSAGGSTRGIDVDANNGPAIVAFSNSYIAINATSPGNTGVWGESWIGTGVLATSLSGVGLEARGGTGGSAGTAVLATNDGTSGEAVRARISLANNSSSAVRAETAGTGAAMQAVGRVVPTSAAVPVAGNGAALDVVGVASFARSGTASVPATKNSVVVKVPGGMTATSRVLATLQQKSGTLVVQAAVPNPANGTVTISLSGAAPAGGLKVAWFVLG